MKRWKKIITAAMILLTLCTLRNIPAMAKSSYNEEVSNARGGVVRVVYLGKRESYIGSAFGVGKAGEQTDIFVTCYHVVNPYYTDKETYESVFVAVGDSVWEDTYDVEMLYASKELDIAIFRTERKVEERFALPMIASSNIDVTTKVYTLGYPGIGDEYSDKTQYERDYSSLIENQLVTAGIITKQTITMDGVDYYMIDADINHGNSGGPTVTEQGFVIGINESIAADSQGGNYVGYVTQVDYVMDILDDLGIAYDSISAEQYEEILNRDEKAAQEASAQQKEEMDKQKEDLEKQKGDLEKQKGDLAKSNQYIIILAIALGAVIVLVLVFLIYMIVRDKKREAQIARERAQFMERSRVENYRSASASGGIPKIIGTQGIFENKSFFVTGYMVIGRSRAKCHLLYPEDTPGVSKVHCALRADNGSLYLTDCNSSYGTFVGNGQRLAPGQPYQLHNGEIFYLAGQQHSFIVRM